MSAARSRDGVFGRAHARLTGDDNFVLERAETVMDAADLAGRPGVDVVGAFRVAPVDEDESGGASVIVDVAGDVSLLLGLVWGWQGFTAVRPTAHRDGIVLFAFEGATAWTLIRIVECASEADATTWLLQLGEPPLRTRGIPPAYAEPPVFEEPPLGGLLESAGEEMPPAPAPDLEAEIGGAVAPSPRSPRMRGVAPPAAAPPEAPTTRAVPREPAGGAGEADAVPANGREAAASVPAHVSGEMPGTTVVGHIAIVEATLSRDRVTPAAGAAFADEAVHVVEDKPVAVSVAARGYRLVSGARRVRSLRLKQGRAKDVVRFALEAVDPGPAEVTLVFRQNDELPLATLRLVSQISAHASADAPVTLRADIVEPEADVLALPTLRIDESVSGGESFLDVAVQIAGARAQGSAKIVDKPQLIADTYQLIADLRTERKAAREARDPDLPALTQAALRRLRRIGVDLSLRLFSREVRQFLWDHVDELDDLLIQTTGELDIPWEIIYVSDPTRSVDREPDVVVDHFLGMRGSTRWVYNAALPREVVVRRGHARYLCPSYTGAGLRLSFTPEEARLVRDAFGAAVVRPGTADAVSQLMAVGFDLLHFAGHGVWSAEPPDQRLLLARYRKTHPAAPNTAYSAATLRRDLPDRDVAATGSTVKLVFLNACDVGRTDASVTGLGGFPEAFLRGGVGVLLGCSWAIDDEIGSAFSRHFYAALKTKDIAEAMRDARHQSLDDDDLSALAYVAYAHPHARVTVA